MLLKNDNSKPHLAANYDEQIQETVPYYNKFYEETINLISAYNLLPKVCLTLGVEQDHLLKS